MTLTPIFEKLSSVIVIVKVNVIVVFSVFVENLGIRDNVLT